jgi:hypothetical protein
MGTYIHSNATKLEWPTLDVVASTATEMQLHSPDPFARRRVMSTDYAAAEEEEEEEGK